MDELLTHEAFTQHANTTFLTQLDEAHGVELELVEVSDLKQSSHQEQFAIVFRGPLDTFLGQGTRSFTHEQLGQFELFLVPISQDDKGFCYEAIFNRIREQP